ncbi:penicillin-binding protein activator, partial [Salmonella enterica subsp. enterica serovar Oslo]
GDESVLHGWLDLHRVWFDNRNDPDMLIAGISDGLKRYPQNPGAKMLPTQLVNGQRFKPACNSKIALLLPLNVQDAVFGSTIQQCFESANNLGTEEVEMQPDAAPDAKVEPGVEETQQKLNNGVAIPSQASVSDLTDDAPSLSA